MSARIKARGCSCAWQGPAGSMHKLTEATSTHSSICTLCGDRSGSLFTVPHRLRLHAIIEFSAKGCAPFVAPPRIASTAAAHKQQEDGGQDCQRYPKLAILGLAIFQSLPCFFHPPHLNTSTTCASPVTTPAVTDVHA
jgi:hypothetical protein